MQYINRIKEKVSKSSFKIIICSFNHLFIKYEGILIRFLTGHTGITGNYFLAFSLHVVCIIPYSLLPRRPFFT